MCQCRSAKSGAILYACSSPAADMAAGLCETAQSHNAGGVYIVHKEDIPPAARAGLSGLRIREEWMMKLSDRVYKWLKWAALYLLPASGTLLGVLLGISTANYNKCR